MEPRVAPLVLASQNRFARIAASFFPPKDGQNHYALWSFTPSLGESVGVIARKLLRPPS
jgi:hypothetical protein